MDIPYFVSKLTPNQKKIILNCSSKWKSQFSLFRAAKLAHLPRWWDSLKFSLPQTNALFIIEKERPYYIKISPFGELVKAHLLANH